MNSPNNNHNLLMVLTTIIVTILHCACKLELLFVLQNLDGIAILLGRGGGGARLPLAPAPFLAILPPPPPRPLAPLARRLVYLLQDCVAILVAILVQKVN